MAVTLEALTDRPAILESLENMAVVAMQEAQWVRGARLWGAATTLRLQLGLPARGLDEESVRQTALLRLQEHSEEASAWQEGSIMTLEQAVAAALLET